MNFVIKCDEYVLHDSRNKELRVGSPMLNTEINKNGTLTFTVYVNHPYYDKLKKMQSIIKVYQNNNIIFSGRILEDAIDIYKSKKITCEGALAYFLDSVCRPFSYQGDVVSFLESIIDSHNAQVSEFQRFILGTVTVTDPNNYITRESVNYLSNYEILRTRLFESSLGGYMRVRYTENGNYVDYLSDFTDTSTQVIEFAKNMVDLENKIDGTNLITGIIPLGAKLTDSSGNETDERLTIKSVNDNKDYLIDTDTSDVYGKIFNVVEWDDVTDATNLKNKGQAYLDSHKVFSGNISVTAVDLSSTSDEIGNFKIGQYVIVNSNIHGISGRYLLQKMSLDISNPANTKIDLGVTYDSLTDITKNQEDMTNSVIDRIGTIETHYVPNTEITGIINETIENNSLINQLPNQILSRVEELYTKETDFNTYTSQLSTQMEQTASEITLQFQNITSLINTLSSDTNQQFSDIVKYIRFVDGNIILGQVDNPFLLKITNNRISFLENNTEVAYMSNGKLYVNDGEFLTTLQLGNYTFSPRANGNLSFFKNRG